MTAELTDKRVRDLFTWAFAWRTMDGAEDNDLSKLRESNAAEFDLWISEHDRATREATWDHCLNEIDANEINTEQAREGNPYRATVVPAVSLRVEPEGAAEPKTEGIFFHDFACTHDPCKCDGQATAVGVETDTPT